MSLGTSQFDRRSILRAGSVAAIGISLGGLAACGSSGPSINFLNWDTYIGDTTLDDFRQETGIGVNMSLFASNDELFAKLRGGNPGFDVIVPSNDYVERLLAANLLEELEHNRIPNFANIAPAFQDAPFDPGRRFSMPYTWLVSGIGYRKSKVDGVPDSWKWVFDSDRYKGRIGMVGDAATLTRLGLLYLGKDIDATDQDALEAVEAMLVRQKGNIAAFHDDNGQDLLLNGDVDLVVEYNGDIAQVMAEDPDLAFVVPREGSELQSDCLCVPKGAPDPARAMEFINFLLDANVGRAIAEKIRYPSPNAEAVKLASSSYRENTATFPPKAEMENCRYPRYQGEKMARLYESILTRVRAA